MVQPCQHWWGDPGRGKGLSLKDFLITASEGYIADKFSYGKERWDNDKASKEFMAGIDQALREGKIDEDEHESMRSHMSNILDSNQSSNTFQMCLWHCPDIEKVWPELYEDSPSGEIGANKKVQWMVDKVWPHFIKELEIGRAHV